MNKVTTSAKALPQNKLDEGRVTFGRDGRVKVQTESRSFLGRMIVSVVGFFHKKEITQQNREAVAALMVRIKEKYGPETARLVYKKEGLGEVYREGKPLTYRLVTNALTDAERKNAEPRNKPRDHLARPEIADLIGGFLGAPESQEVVEAKRVLTRGGIAPDGRLQENNASDEMIRGWIASGELNPVCGITVIDLSGSKVSTKGLRMLAESGALRNVENLNLSGLNLGDEGAQILANCNDLKKLKSLTFRSIDKFRSNELGSNGFKAISKMQGLESLDITDNAMPDLRVIAKLKNLKSLKFGSMPNLAGEGRNYTGGSYNGGMQSSFQALSGMNNLKELGIKGCCVGSLDFAMGNKMPELKSLEVRNCDVFGEYSDNRSTLTGLRDVVVEEIDCHWS